MAIRIAYVGAGSETFGVPVVDNVLGSNLLRQAGVNLVLMDINSVHLHDISAYAQAQASHLGTAVRVETTTDLSAALTGADFVISAFEVNRHYYWAQDYHVPRQFGFNQVYGENGEIGGLFHALRNIPPMMEMVRTMERLCPEATLLNFSNPEHKLCEAVNRLSKIRAVGLCPGVYLGREQIAQILERPVQTLDTSACGINHFTWFQHIRDAESGTDLYPALRERDRLGDELSRWHEIGLARILFRRFGLWPSPAANHCAEYLQWSKEFVANNMQFFYDPAGGSPWSGGGAPEFVYSIDRVESARPWIKQPKEKVHGEDEGMDVDAIGAEMAVMIIEGLACDQERVVPSGNVRNNGAIPGIADDTVVEVPITINANGIQPHEMKPLPEAIAATIRLHGSIHKLLVDAYANRSRDTLLQALLLDPTVTDYRRAVEMMNTMIELQKERLPELR